MSVTVSFGPATNGPFPAEYLQAFRHIESEGLRHEVARFISRTPESNRPTFERPLGGGDPIRQVLARVHQALLESFETRLSRWARRVDQSESDALLHDDVEMRCLVNDPRQHRTYDEPIVQSTALLVGMWPGSTANSVAGVLVAGTITTMRMKTP